MSHFPPDEYAETETDDLSRAARRLLCEKHDAVVAMSSGGCARYAFSMDLKYCLDRNGLPLIHYSSDNAHHHLIVTNSTMSFRLVFEHSPDGVELSILNLTGMLTLVDPGDHDNMDRFCRYFDVNIENYSRGNERLYRFAASSARLDFISGMRRELSLPLVIQKMWRSSEETELLNHANKAAAGLGSRGRGFRFAGVDPYGIDLQSEAGITRLPFAEPVTTVAAGMLAVSNEMERNPLLTL